jgi:hypothetical protein
MVTFVVLVVVAAEKIRSAGPEMDHIAAFEARRRTAAAESADAAAAAAAAAEELHYAEPEETVAPEHEGTGYPHIRPALGLFDPAEKEQQTPVPAAVVDSVPKPHFLRQRIQAKPCHLEEVLKTDHGNEYPLEVKYLHHHIEESKSQQGPGGALPVGPVLWYQIFAACVVRVAFDMKPEPTLSGPWASLAGHRDARKRYEE